MLKLDRGVEKLTENHKCCFEIQKSTYLFLLLVDFYQKKKDKF